MHIKILRMEKDLMKTFSYNKLLVKVEAKLLNDKLIIEPKV